MVNEQNQSAPLIEPAEKPAEQTNHWGLTQGEAANKAMDIITSELAIRSGDRAEWVQSRLMGVRNPAELWKAVHMLKNADAHMEEKGFAAPMPTPDVPGLKEAKEKANADFVQSLSQQ